MSYNPRMDDKYSKLIITGLIAGSISAPLVSCKGTEPIRFPRLGYSIQMAREECKGSEEEPHVHQEVHVFDSTLSTSAYVSASGTGPTSILGSSNYFNDFNT